MMFQGNTFKKNEIDYQFIVVYERFNKKVANSIKNEAVGKGVKSTIWSEKDYRDNEAKLTNYNHVLFLSEKLIEETLSNPKLKENPLIPCVFYKKEGNSFGIYICDDYAKLASEYKEYAIEKLKVELIKYLGKVIYFCKFFFWSEIKQFKLSLYFKAGDSFIEEHLEAWIKHS